MVWFFKSSVKKACWHSTRDSGTTTLDWAQSTVVRVADKPLIVIHRRPYLIGVVPEKALKLVVNDTAREYFTASNGGGSITLAQEIASGALAGFCQVVATAPMERTKIQMQVMHRLLNVEVDPSG